MNPNKNIREFDGHEYIGKFVCIECHHTNAEVNDKLKEPTNQYISCQLGEGEASVRVSGWVGHVLGKKGAKVRKKIVKVTLIEHMNGGRGSYEEASSYKKFFNDSRKKMVLNYWKNGQGIGGILFGIRGNPDRADIKVYFDDFVIDSYAYDFEAPEEWYSELHKDNRLFLFPDGFYENADTAVAAFAMKKSDDLFGERFFPVIVFPILDEIDAVHMESVATNTVAEAKSCSRTIIKDNQIIIGTRCKGYEYEDVIRHTYQRGGRVPIGLEWSWD